MAQRMTDPPTVSTRLPVAEVALGLFGVMVGLVLVFLANQTSMCVPPAGAVSGCASAGVYPFWLPGGIVFIVVGLVVFIDGYRRRASRIDSPSHSRAV
jgi:hypothetical protein